MDLSHPTSQRLLFALSEIETHWDSYEGCLRELIERIKNDPPDPRIANGDFCREELGDPVGYYEHELASLLKNRDLLRAVFAELKGKLAKLQESFAPFGEGMDVTITDENTKAKWMSLGEGEWDSMED